MPTRWTTPPRGGAALCVGRDEGDASVRRKVAALTPARMAGCGDSLGDLWDYVKLGLEVEP